MTISSKKDYFQIENFAFLSMFRSKAISEARNNFLSVFYFRNIFREIKLLRLLYSAQHVYNVHVLDNLQW